MISVDLTLVLHIINMIVLMFVLNSILYKPVLGILSQRREKFDSLAADVEKLEENARLRQEEVNIKMREASAKAKKALDDARSEAQAVGSAKVSEIKEAVDKDKEKQLLAIKEQMEKARKELLDNVSDFAKDMASKVLGRELKG